MAAKGRQKKAKDECKKISYGPFSVFQTRDGGGLDKCDRGGERMDTCGKFSEDRPNKSCRWIELGGKRKGH